MKLLLKLDIGEGAEAFSFAFETGDSPFSEELPLGSCSIITPCQTHTSNVAWVHEKRPSLFPTPDPAFPDTDALLTTNPDISVGVRTADCVPIVLNAPDIGVIGAVHAGWKGTLARIVEKTVRTMIDYGANPALIHAAMGPCICGDCYEVSEELAATFGCNGRHIDLPGQNMNQLIACGVPAANICRPTACTLHTSLRDSGNASFSMAWPSWRRHPGTAHRLFTIIRRLKQP